MSLQRFAGFAVLAGLAATAACSDSTAPPRAAEVRVEAPASLVVGENQRATATVLTAKGVALTDRTIQWASSDNTVLTVTQTGLLFALKPGAVTLTASADGKTGNAQVAVTAIPVHTLTIAPGTVRLRPGRTVRLEAQPRDANGTLLFDRPVFWTTSAPGVVSVAADGTVTGLAVGTATISARVDEKTATLEIPVLEASSVVLTAIAPETLVEGQAATLSGRGFSAVAADNLVLVDGVPLPVLSATPTSLQVQVPAAMCLPARRAAVQVVVAGDSSDVFSHAARPSAYLDVPVGQQVVLGAGADKCLQLRQTSADEAYLIGVQSISDVASALTNVRFRGVGGLGPAASARGAAVPSFSRTPAVRAAPALPVRWAEHRAAEAALRVRERRDIQAAVAAGQRAGVRPRAARALSSAQAALPNVGDTLTLRVPDLARNSCTNSTTIRAVVRVVGERGIWVEDAGNPTGGFSLPDFQKLSDVFDRHIYKTDVENFGEPLDADGNGRVLILTTKEINRFNAGSSGGSVLGFVAGADVVGSQFCASSNNAEIYYGMAPDPSGTLGRAYALETALADAQSLIAHEFAHVIHYSRRRDGFFANTGVELPEIWELEGQATLAETLVGHAINGRGAAGNYGYDVAFNRPKVSEIDWHYDAFVDLAIYFGFRGPTTRSENAPEGCGWQDRNTGGPCAGGREVYGVPSFLLQYLNDQYGPTYPGGPAALQRDLLAKNPGKYGFANLEALVGVPMSTILARWAAALYVDDRIPGAARELTFSSWNLADVFGKLGANNPSATLEPRQRAFGSFTDDVSVRAGSSAYFLVSGANRPATALAARDWNGQLLPPQMQMWVVRLR